MAKIKDSCPKSSSGGYERVFADKQIGDAIQRVQSTVIRNGNELEKIIESNSVLVADLSEFLDNVQYGQTHSVYSTSAGGLICLTYSFLNWALTL